METITYKNYTIEIENDESAMNPREEWDNSGTMVCFHKRYDLGDKDHGYRTDDYNSWDELEKDIKKKEDVACILPIYMYDHSGITINTTGFSCQWDSGQIGFIFVSKAKAREIWGWKVLTQKRLNSIEGYLKGEITTYDHFLTGSVYGYTVKKDDEEFDSCWGFFGSDHEKSGLMEYAKNAIDCEVKEELKKHGEQQELELA